MEKTAIIFKHTHKDGSCFLGKTLREFGFKVRSIGTPGYDFEGFDPLEPDLLLIMGGPVGVYQADDFPFLDEEVEVIKRRIEANRPVLGICLGAQLIAKALGADVYLGKPGKEIGWQPLRLTPEGGDHPVRYLSGKHTNMFHWHNDTFDLPDGATLLASSEMYPNQIYSYGETTLALQCHTEVRQARMMEWYISLVKEITGPDALIDIKDLKAETKKYIKPLNVQTSLFFTEWLAQIGLIEAKA